MPAVFLNGFFIDLKTGEIMRYLILFLLLSITAWAQSENISGLVVNNAEGRAIPGVNIYIKGGGKGTVSGKDGTFSLEINSKKDIIVFSHVAYKKLELEAVEIINSGWEKFILDTKIFPGQTVLIEGAVGEKGVTPLTFSKIERKDIETAYTTQDIPEYLSYLPSTTFYSEGGAGYGYNYISIRGFGQRRISVSINGIPQNEPEDHNVYWLDFPDLLESTGFIQVQRGAGSGITGYPSIGGSINIITSPFSEKSEMKFYSSYGSYNTRKYGVALSSGLIDNKYSVYFKLSQLLSSGYREGNWIDFKSYHLSAVRYDDKLTTQLNIYGGPVADGLVYNGLPKFAINDRELRKKNYSWWSADDNNITYAAERRPEEIENFSQPHFEILNEYTLNDNVTLNSALFLVLGEGFFDYDGSWGSYSYFRITPENGFNINEDPTTLYMGEALIRAKVENKQWGWIPRISYKHGEGKLIVGGEFRFHNSVHWGSINYAQSIPAGVGKDYRYYYYEGKKDIVNVFANETYNINSRLNILAEIQLAWHRYASGNEKYLDNEFSIDNLFFNPRLGLNYKFSDNFSSYLSYAMVSREPRLKTYYDAAESSGGAVPQFVKKGDGSYDFDDPLVKPEKMNAIELGCTYRTNQLELTSNLFYMHFTDEIVKNGQLDRFGQPVTGNMDNTVHMGLELSANYHLNDYIDIIANGTYSRNYISDGKIYVSDANSATLTSEIDLTDNEIGGFPELMFNGIVQMQYKGVTGRFYLKYVGDYYSDNYGDKIDEYNQQVQGFTDYNDNKVDSWFLMNFFASYEFDINPVFRKIKTFIQVNNIFDTLYASTAIGKEFFPGAERNFLAGISLGL